MIDYVELKDADTAQLRRERVLALEADHFRTTLLLAEEVDPDARAAMITSLIDYQRRIEAHVPRAEMGADTAES